MNKDLNLKGVFRSCLYYKKFLENKNDLYLIKWCCFWNEWNDIDMFIYLVWWMIWIICMYCVK